jgi:hypothetical protein
MEAHMIGTAFFDEEGDGINKRRLALRHLLEIRFGPLSPAALEKIDSWPLESLRAHLEAAVTAASLHELGLEDVSA